MRILIIWKSDYPWDVRVEKFATSLNSFGHEVHILARNLHKQVAEDRINDIYIHRLEHFKNDFLNNVSSTPMLYNPIWMTRGYQICNEYSIDLIIIRDLPLVPAGVYIGKRFGIPTIFDMAENYAAMWKDVIISQWYKPSNYIFKNPLIGRLLEKYSVHNVDHVLVVIDESKHRLTALGLNASKISIVNNTPELQNFDNLSHDKSQFGWDNKMVLLYTGFVNKGRGLDIVIRSMPALIRDFPSLYFVVAGDGRYISQLKTLCKKMNVEDHVQFYGWVNFEKIPAMIKSADICLVPHIANEHKNTTIPNKVFDYMACSKPVIVSDSIPLKRIAEEENCGLVFKSKNVESFTSIASQMINNPSLRYEMGNRGRVAVEKKYNWEYDSLVLKGVVEKFQ